MLRRRRGLSSIVIFPILYVKKDSVPLATSAALFDLGLSTRYIIGGTAVSQVGR